MLRLIDRKKNQCLGRLSLLNFYLAALLLAVVSLSLPNLTLAQSSGVIERKAGFSQPGFKTIWERVDQAVATKKAERSWYWGPEPLSEGLYEPYMESPYGQRLVQYFDKTRMEINNPTTGQVTNGLLVVEMITGQAQQGDNTFDEQLAGGAEVPVVGDFINKHPTYKQLASVYKKPVFAKLGEPVTQFWESTGLSLFPFELYKTDNLTAITNIQNGYGIPQAFWGFINRTGAIYANGRYVEAVLSDWQFSVGLPVTPAFWTRVQVGGVEKDVLFQAFERRVLTYTPTNPLAYQVEMGNVGRHYVQWRYKDKLPSSTNPLVNLFTTPLQAGWYEATEALNIRTAPAANSTRPSYTQVRPFFAQLQKGDRLKPIRVVSGEEVEPGNDMWLQVYEKPDLFIYSKYMKPISLPDFPTPPRYYKGLWVAVSLKKQMLAVYNGQERLLTTLVATGRTEYDKVTGEYRDYSTVTGSFAAIDGWRPLTQTMEGGNRASGDFYKLEDVRYVTYFYRDFAIHGSYWHAKYGLVPQSRGCVNATVYDASLVHQLPAGTPVEVFS